jgi:hypothetical protein
MVFPQALGKSGLKPAFSRKSKVAVPKLKFWNSLNYQALSAWSRKPASAGGFDEGFVEVSGKLEEESPEQGPGTFCGMVIEHGSIRVRLPAGATRRDLELVVQTLRQSYDA